MRAAAPYLQSILRIVVGFTFSCHGLQKLFGAFGGKPVPAFSLLWFAGILETCGGPLMAAGLFTSLVAFLLCGEMAVAYFLHHFPRGFWPIHNGGELAVLYCFIYLYLAVAGAGPLSLDRVIRRKR